MKMKKATKIIFVVLVLTIAFCIFGTPRYQSMKIKSLSFVELQNKLKEAVNTDNEVDIKKLTNFQWDESYVFNPYYPSRDVYEKVGKEWTMCNSYIGFLLFHGAENETVNDDQYLIVFKKDNKVILSEIYSLNELPVIFKVDNSKFTRDNGTFIVRVAKQYNEGKIKELILKN